MFQCVGGLGWSAVLLDFILKVTTCAPTAPHCSHLLATAPYLLSTAPTPNCSQLLALDLCLGSQLQGGVSRLPLLTTPQPQGSSCLCWG